MPYPSDMDSIRSGTNAFTSYNGPTFPGYMPLEISSVSGYLVFPHSDDSNSNPLQSECAKGTYRPGYYGGLVLDDDTFPYEVECLPCPAGQYCPNTGMSSADAYDCDGGVVCGSGAYDHVGYQNGAGTECEKGYECAAGALH